MEVVNGKLFSVLILVLSVTGCFDEGDVNTKLQQAIAIQKYTAGFAAACDGKLSMESEYTGETKIPVVTKISCDEMNKESQFFTPLDDKGIEELEEQIRKINNIE